MKKLVILLIMLVLGSTFAGCQNGMQDESHSSDQSTSADTSQPTQKEVLLQSEVIETTPCGMKLYTFYIHWGCDEIHMEDAGVIK